MVSVNEHLNKGQAVTKMGRQVDRLLGPLQERKIAELQARFARLQGEVRLFWATLPCNVHEMAHLTASDMPSHCLANSGLACSGWPARVR